MDEAPKGSKRGSAEINRTFALYYPYVGHPAGPSNHVPGGNGAAGKRATWTKPRRGRSAGALRSVGASRCTTLKLANPLALRTMSPAGMEPLGSERHGRSPEGVEARER